MPGNSMSTHAVDHVRKSVARGIQIGRIDLLDVTTEDDLGSFTNSGDDRSDLMG
jgi:hypothetical protein